jgi:hypothetical protein
MKNDLICAYTSENDCPTAGRAPQLSVPTHGLNQSPGEVVRRMETKRGTRLWWMRHLHVRPPTSDSS